MEGLRNIMKLLLVTKDYFLGWHTLRQLHLQCFLLLLLLFEQEFFTVGHKPSWARLFEYIIDGSKLHIGHLDYNLELLLLHYVFHMRHVLMLMVPLELILLHLLVEHDSHVVLLQKLTSLGLNVKQRTTFFL